jgi:PPM family protein phosphatase
MKRLRHAYRKTRFYPVRVCFNCGAPVVPNYYATASGPGVLCQICRLLRTGDPDGIVPDDEDEDDDDQRARRGRPRRGAGGAPTPLAILRLMVQALQVDVAAVTDRGKKREANEDAYSLFRIGRFAERIGSNIPESELPSVYETRAWALGVADGMGGHAAGEVASKDALVELQRLALKKPRWLMSLDDPETREREIQEFFDRTKMYLAGVHAAILDEAVQDPGKRGMGTTFTLAYLVGLDLFIVHVGDSRVYRMHGGKLTQLTHDHTVAQRLADAGVIAQESVATHPERNRLTQVVGGSGGWIRGETHHVRLEAGDMLLLCSDGLNAVVHDDEIAHCLAGATSSESACRDLVERTLAGGAPDNVTVVVARLGSE